LKQQELVSSILEFPLLQRCHQTDFLSAQCCTADKETTVHQKRKSVLSIQQQNRNKKNLHLQQQQQQHERNPTRIATGKKKKKLEQSEQQRGVQTFGENSAKLHPSSPLLRCSSSRLSHLLL
jgi:hypothetical protein